MEVKRGIFLIGLGLVLMVFSKPLSMDSFSLLFFVFGFILAVSGMVVCCIFSERVKNEQIKGGEK